MPATRHRDGGGRPGSWHRARARYCCARQARESGGAVPPGRRRQHRCYVGPALADQGDVVVHLARVTAAVIPRACALRDDRFSVDDARVEGHAPQGARHRPDVFGGQQRAAARVDDDGVNRVEFAVVRLLRTGRQCVPAAAQRISDRAEQPHSRQRGHDLEGGRPDRRGDGVLQQRECLGPDDLVHRRAAGAGMPSAEGLLGVMAQPGDLARPGRQLAELRGVQPGLVTFHVPDGAVADLPGRAGGSRGDAGVQPAEPGQRVPRATRCSGRRASHCATSPGSPPRARRPRPPRSRGGRRAAGR